jgi:hypothetical protein
MRITFVPLAPYPILQTVMVPKGARLLSLDLDPFSSQPRLWVEADTYQQLEPRQVLVVAPEMEYSAHTYGESRYLGRVPLGGAPCHAFELS